jgi:predicted DNA binding CopG/RHH family protein
MSATKLKELPPLLTDEDAERFTEEADLSEYDLSGFRPMRFEFRKKEERLNMRLPGEQLHALKAMAEKMGIPYTRLARQFIEEGLQSAKS